MDNENKLVAACLQKAQKPDGRKKLMCVEAFALAKQFNVPPARIGTICNQNNIKICKCQLGCFA